MGEIALAGGDKQGRDLMELQVAGLPEQIYKTGWRQLRMATHQVVGGQPWDQGARAINPLRCLGVRADDRRGR